jgi:tetratricopeptide (TPR) repeat protein
VVLVLAEVHPSAQSVPRLGGLLDLYERGEHDAALAPLGAWPNLDRLFDRLRSDGTRWVAAAGPDAIARRRLIAAAYALEAARLGMANWEDARHLVEWGCEVLRGGPPQPAERTWQLASVALIQGASDVIFLAGLPRGAPDPHPDRGAAIDHLTHAELRFPDEDRFRLARVVVQEFRGWGQDSKRPRLADPQATSVPRSSSVAGPRTLLLLDAREATSDVRFDRATAEQLADGVTRLGGFRDYMAARKSLQLWRLVDAFEPFLKIERTRADAHVRLGHTYLRLAQPDRAAEQFQHVAGLTSDPFILYLARFFTARMQQAAEDRAAAIASYREALQIVPRAESASIALAALLFTGDERDDAYDVVAAALTPGPPVQDPWRQYPSGSFHLWPTLVARLREELR